MSAVYLIKYSLFRLLLTITDKLAYCVLLVAVIRAGHNCQQIDKSTMYLSIDFVDDLLAKKVLISDVIG